MYKSYWLSLFFCLLTIGIVGYTRMDDALDKEAGKDQKIEYSVVFNAATLEQKIIGLPYDEISKRYEPAEMITGKKKSGYFSAHYTNLQIFTRGEDHIVRGMTVQFKNGIAASIKPDKPDEKERLAAKVLNLNPLAFKMIDSEFGTREVAVLKGTPEGFKKYLILAFGLLFLLLLSAGGFFIVWPLVTLLVKKSGGWTARILGIVLILAVTWLWFPFIAYTADNIGMYMGVGLPVTLLGLVSLFVSTKKRRFIPRGTDNGFAYGLVAYSCPFSFDLAINHMQNLWTLIMLDPESERFDLHTEISERIGLDSEDYKRTMENEDSTMVHIPSEDSLKDDFVDDYIEMLLCHTPVLYDSVLRASLYAQKMGYDVQTFVERMSHIARTKYGLSGGFVVEPKKESDPEPDEPSNPLDSLFNQLKK